MILYLCDLASSLAPTLLPGEERDDCYATLGLEGDVCWGRLPCGDRVLSIAHALDDQDPIQRDQSERQGDAPSVRQGCEDHAYADSRHEPVALELPVVHALDSGADVVV